MNDAEREYDRLVKSMENEVLALKTAHQRPLGALNFFKDAIDFDVDLTESFGVRIATFNVVVEIATPAVTPPIVQAGWDTPAGFYYVTYLYSSISGDYSVWTYRLRLLTTNPIAQANMKFGATSSQPIESITWSYA